MNRNRKIGAAALGTLLAATLSLSGVGWAQQKPATRQADIDTRTSDDGGKVRLSAGTTRVGAGVAGRDARMTTSGVPSADRTRAARRVTVTVPRYQSGTMPTVTTPRYKPGTDPSVDRDDNRVVIDVGNPAKLTLPSVRQGKPGKLTPPGVAVD